MTGTILCFEMGLLWPVFMGGVGASSGCFSREAISFFVEAIFLGIYLYGWDRLSPRVHFLSRIPDRSVAYRLALRPSANAWMQPAGFRHVDGRAVDVEPMAATFGNPALAEFIHMELAAYMAAGVPVAGVYAWGVLRGRRRR